MTLSVALVLDRDFAEPVDELALRMPVWIISSKKNDLAVEKARRVLRDPSRVTTLLAVAGEDEGDTLLRALYDIDEHHGPVSAARPYKQILIFGAAPELLSPELMGELELEVSARHPGGFSLQKHSALA